MRFSGSRVARRTLLSGIAVAVLSGGGAAAAVAPGTGTTLRYTIERSGQGAGAHAIAATITVSVGRLPIVTPGRASSTAVILKFTPVACSAAPCLKLAGTLTGHAVAQRSLPDTGQGYSVSASGHLVGLGSTTATGTLHGTGFIATGHCTLTLTLRSSSGSQPVIAQSGPVRGFTSPL
jgi:hypothetical protein